MQRRLMTMLAMLTFCLAVNDSKGQDTIYITAAQIKTDLLREGTHRYLVYFKMGKNATRTQTQFWTRTIKRTDFNGKPAIEVEQAWEDKDSIIHVVKSVSDAKTMQPLYHNTWWKVATSRTSSVKAVNETTIDFLRKSVEHNGRQLSDADTARQSKPIWAGYKSSLDIFFFNWHLDLETFPLLPYKKGITFIVPFYDPGTASGYQQVAYTVTGSADLIGYNDQKIDCWLLAHESKGNKELFWVSKKTREVLKMEQEVNGTMYRYKIKLGFSM